MGTFRITGVETVGWWTLVGVRFASQGSKRSAGGRLMGTFRITVVKTFRGGPGSPQPQSDNPGCSARCRRITCGNRFPEPDAQTGSRVMRDGQ
jgi:hypothetical protein